MSGYPTLLPYVPLTVREPRSATWEEFSRDYPNMPDEQPEELVAVVPPPMSVGMSLWGRSGDAEGVVIVFECDLDAREVIAYNLCS